MGHQTQLQELQHQVRSLQARVQELEARDTSPRRAPTNGWATKDELEALRALVSQDDIAWNRPDRPTPEFKQQVADAMSALRKDEVQEKHEYRAARLDARINWLTEKLGLDRYQSSEMRTILASQDERNTALIQMWQDGVDDQILGETKETNRQLFDTEIQRVLTPEQITTLRELQADQK